MFKILKPLLQCKNVICIIQINYLNKFNRCLNKHLHPNIEVVYKMAGKTNRCQI